MRTLFRGLGWLVGGTLLAAFALHCGGGSTGTDPCPNGICSGTGDMAGSGVCTENWICSSFETTGSNSNAGTRTCRDANNCGTTNNKPALTATLPKLDMNYFKCNVQPILDGKCAQQACHGSETDRALRVYARGRLRNSETIPANTASICPLGNAQAVPLDSQCTGSVEGVCRSCSHTPTEWQKNYDSARAFGLDASLQPIPMAQLDTSDLIAQPVVGGKVHANIHLFDSGSTDHTTIKSWLSGMTLATCTTQD